jgi:CHAT domain-containing protein
MLLDLLAGSSADEDLTMEERDRRIELDSELAALNARIGAATRTGGQLDPKLAAAREQLRQSRDEFYLGLDARHPRVGFASGRAPVLSAKAIAAALPAKSALVEFVAGSRGTWIMLLVPHGAAEPRLVIKPSPLSTDKLRALAEEFTRQVATRDLSFGANARALYDALLGPIDADLGTIDEVIVVPHSVLWEVPFQALMTPRRKFFVEEHAVAYTPSASALKALEARSRPPHASPRVVAFGDPLLKDPKAERLPNAAREAEAVAEVYRTNTAVATDAEATEAKFRALAPRADIIHIATHGILDDASPMFSYVMLSGSGANRAADGRLEGRELINMQLDAELVVLSACDTARGRIANGEGVVGLSWALFAAGASTTAVSLWPVVSASTTELMTTFHRERRGLIASGVAGATAQALRVAQQKALANPESRHPFYWAGFVVIGVP